MLPADKHGHPSAIDIWRVRGRKLLLPLALLLILQGCADDFKPTLTFVIPNSYQGAKGAQPPPVISRWWTRFGSNELDRLIEAANIDNLDIAVAVAQLQQAEAQIDITAAPLWPQFSYFDNNQRTRVSGTLVPGVINKPVEVNAFTKEITASYIVDVWGQNRDALRASIRTATSSAYQVEVIRLTTYASVVNNYLAYAANWERATVAERNLVNAERILKVIRERRDAGTASDLDVSQQETLVESQRATIPPLRQAAETARIAIALLVGQPAQAIRLDRKSARGLHLPTVRPGIPSDLLFRRPDIRAAEEQLASSDASVQVARKAFLPTIQLTGDAGFASARLSTLLRPESFIYTIAASLTQPIFQGGRLKGQLKLTEAQRQQFLEAYRKSIVSALTDVENALVAIRENLAREKAQNAAVIAARRAFRLSEDRLNQGVIDITQLLTIQNTLFQAEDLLIQVRLARLQALVSLFQALGGDWEEPVVVTSRYVD